MSDHHPRTAETALTLDKAAFPLWWQIVTYYLRGAGIGERLFARAFTAGYAAGRSDGGLTIKLETRRDVRAVAQEIAALDPGLPDNHWDRGA